MGMFDWVDYKTECYSCKYEVTGFQTKNLGCTLVTVTPEEAGFFYSTCDNCGLHLNVEFIPPQAPMLQLEWFKKGERGSSPIATFVKERKEDE